MAGPKGQKRNRGGRRGRRSAVVGDQLAMQVTGPKLQVHHFRRVFQEVITGSASGVLAYSPVVSLSKFPSVTEFTALFNQYRVHRLTIIFTPSQDALSTSNPFPTVNTVFDYTANTSLGSVTEAQQFQSWKQTVFNASKSQLKIVYAPRMTQSGVASASGSGSEVLPAGMFVTTDNTNVVFFGLRTIWENLATTQSVRISVIADFVFRGVK